MKKKLFKSIIAVCLSAAMLILSAVPAFAYADDTGKVGIYSDLEDRSYTREELEDFVIRAEDSFNYMFQTEGNKWYMPAVDEEEAAIENAKQVLANPDADSDEITAAYVRLHTALYASKNAHDYLDERKLLALLNYSRMLVDDYKDCFSKDEYEIVRNCYGYLMSDWHYGANTQEKVEIAVESACSKLNQVEKYEENSDMVWPREFVKLMNINQYYFRENEHYCNYTPIYRNFNGYRLFRAGFYEVSDANPKERIGKYIYSNSNECYPSKMGYLLVSAETGYIFTLENGLKKGIVDEDVIYEMIKNKELDFNMSLAGDPDFDGVITIADATAVQMKISYLSDYVDVDDIYFDFNNDGKVDIADATDIQRYIAGFDTDTKIDFNLIDKFHYNPAPPYDGRYSISEAFLIKSRSELDSFLENDLHKLEDDMDRVISSYDKYDESFFKDNSLVICHDFKTWGIEDVDIIGMKVSGNTLYVDTVTTFETFAEPINCYRLSTYSVSKADVASVANVENNNSVVYIEYPYSN